MSQVLGPRSQVPGPRSQVPSPKSQSQSLDNNMMTKDQSEGMTVPVIWPTFSNPTYHTKRLYSCIKVLCSIANGIDEISNCRYMWLFIDIIIHQKAAWVLSFVWAFISQVNFGQIWNCLCQIFYNSPCFCHLNNSPKIEHFMQEATTPLDQLQAKSKRGNLFCTYLIH